MSEPTAEQIEHDGPDPIERNGVVYVALKLAHPLSEEQAGRMQALVAKPYNVGNTIRLTREWANAVIDAGYAQVDVENKKAVRAALFLNHRDQPLSMDEVRALAEARSAAAADAATPAKAEAQQDETTAAKASGKAAAKSGS